MSRIRTIKPEFWTDAKTGTLSEFSKCLFIGLLNYADDYGVLKWSPVEWRAKIFPYHSDTTTGTINASFLNELLPRGLVIWFGHSDNEVDTEQYIWIRTFGRHQVVNKPGKPLLKDWKITDNPKIYADRIGADFRELSDITTVPLPEDEFNTPELPNTERKGKERKGKEDIENSSNFLSPKKFGQRACSGKMKFEKKDFERFWTAYGHKQQRKRAEQAFATAIAKTTIEMILEAVKRYHETRPTWQQIALASSWLNGERWNDEDLPTPPARPGPPRKPRVQNPHLASYLEDHGLSPNGYDHDPDAKTTIDLAAGAAPAPARGAENVELPGVEHAEREGGRSAASPLGIATRG